CVGATEVVRARAIKDLNCPSEQISVYEAADEATVARGCGAWTEYQCFNTRSRVVCVREAPAQLNGAPPEPKPLRAPRPAPTREAQSAIQPDDTRTDS